MKFKTIFLNLKHKLCSFYKKDKKIFIAISICLVIFVVLIFSTISDLTKSKNQNSTKNQVTSPVTSYASEIENKLESLISKLDNIKTVSVLVMVESTPTVNYLTESTEKTETKENSSTSEKTQTVVFEKNGSNSIPIIVTTINPKITGVLIVTNKINQSTKISIINSVSVVLNIDESCISLLQES